MVFQLYVALKVGANYDYTDHKRGPNVVRFDWRRPILVKYEVIGGRNDWWRETRHIIQNHLECRSVAVRGSQVVIHRAHNKYIDRVYIFNERGS